MNNYFTATLANIIFKPIPQPNKETDEKPFIDDLFHEKIAEVGHIRLAPGQNSVCITVNMSAGEVKAYHITEPRMEFLKFIFENTNRSVKKALRFYAQAVKTE